jgi:hypothetical protein
MLPGNLYNKGNQILQAPGYVVIRNEMVHETRVIPVDRRPHVGSGIRTYMGDGRGHWEGNTLVVETTNFKKDIGMNGINFALLTDALRIVERFARVAPDELSYDATIEDPGTWARPWTIHVPFKSGNYSGAAGLSIARMHITSSAARMWRRPCAGIGECRSANDFV